MIFFSASASSSASWASKSSLKRCEYREDWLDLQNCPDGGLHAPFTSSSAIGSWRVNPIIDAYFHLFTKKDHLFKICEIDLFVTINGTFI